MMLSCRTGEATVELDCKGERKSYNEGELKETFKQCCRCTMAVPGTASPLSILRTHGVCLTIRFSNDAVALRTGVLRMSSDYG